MSDLITVSKDDSQFWPLLTGQFSKQQFAQPIKNLYVNSVDETVTFRILDQSQPSLIKALAQWYSLARNIYLIFPILGGVSFLVSRYGFVDAKLLLFSFLGLQTFLMALTLYNDYSDYINGVDRVNEYNSEKPLIQGLIRPYQARRLSQIFLVLSLVLSSYCFYQRPGSLLLALVAVGIGFFFSAPFVSKRFKGLSVVMTFLLAGPLLVVGYEYLLFEKMSLASILLGFVFGLHAIKYDFCKQTRDIYYNSKAQVITGPSFFGFGRSKSLYSLLSVAHVLLLSYLVLQLQRPELMALVLLALCFEIYINRLFHGAQSFLSSNVGYCLGLQKLHYTIESCLMVFFFLSPLWTSLL